MQKELTIQNPLGIHSRPAGAVTKKALQYPCDVRIVKGSKEVNAKSIIGVLSLEMKYGDQILLITAGDQEEEALKGIGDLLESDLE
ncbi:HPr family phosphocarrier protein [Paenibacillus sp. P96]|uniref:HPr family phosphocarrier protein n=1 Tax=Paenibacillus zeirhizosphaerae TaxID=2987519 RepID=A0ABT9FV60_9BACL|nr:HPr family phosphocarrier protein [Paenibacillus sp. P96]MDP4098352.1 HPr family phosphocarrier protein [Paenibacillus sp. P96]